MSASLIFPGSRPPSIVSAIELNFRVRDGNGWDLKAIDTDYELQVQPAVTSSFGWTLVLVGTLD